MSTVIKYDSYAEVMQADLAKIPDKMLEGAKKALNDAADFMVVIARNYCPVDTGTLQNSIRKTVSVAVSPYAYSVRVEAGGRQYINPKTNRPCDYAVYVEARTPFMAPAYATIRKFLEKNIRERVLAEVKKV